MRRNLFFVLWALLVIGLAGCASTATTELVDGEKAEVTSGVNLDNVNFTVAKAVQSLLQLDRIKTLPGASRAVTVVPETKVDIAGRGTGADALARAITLRLREELTNSDKIIVFNPEAARYASGKVPPVQYVLESRLESRNVPQDNGMVQIEYYLNLTLIDKASGLEYWQKSVALRKVATRARSL